MKVAALQMVSTPDVQRNLEAAAALMRDAAAAGAQLVVLPEYFCFMGARDTDKLAIAELPDASEHEVAELERAGVDAVLVAAGDVAALVPAEPPDV